MNDKQAREKAVQKLTNLSNTKGYVSFDDIIEVIESQDLPLEEVDRVSEVLLINGCIIKEEDTRTIDIDEEDIGFTDRSKLNYDDIFDAVISLDKSLEGYINEVRKIPPPQYKEAENLIHQAKSGNRFAKNRMILMYLKIVVKIALWASQKYRIPIDTAIQDGNWGLVIALEKYEPDQTNKFSTYAPWWIRQKILREMPVVNTQVYFPVHVRYSLFNIYNLVLAFDQSECSDGYVDENLIHEVMDLISVDYETAKIYTLNILPSFNLEELLDTFEENFSDNGLFENKMVEDIDVKMCKEAIQKTLSSLKPREQEVINLRYGLIDGIPRTLEIVGNMLGVTRERIRQIESKAFKRLRHPSRSKFLKCYYNY